MPTFLQFSESLTKIGLCATVPCNLVLIYLTAYHCRQITGTYKHMLIFFAASCIVFSSLEVVARPFTHNFNGCFLYFSLNDYMGLSQDFLQYALAVYAGLYAMNVSFIAVQFVFRYWTLIDHWGLRTFQGKRRLLWAFYLLFVIVTYGCPILIFLQPSEFNDGYLRENFNKYYDKDISEYARFFIIPYEHFKNSTGKRIRWENVSFLLSAIPILSFQYIVVIYCTVQMQLNMKQRLKNFSGINKALQVQFFRALVVQIILPTLLYSLPALPCLLVPILDLKMSVQSGVIIGLFSMYPPLDSLALMLIVSEYRRSVRKIFWKISTNQVVSSVTRGNSSVTQKGESVISML